MDLLEPALLDRRVEQRASVGAVDGAYGTASSSSTEKSSSPIASSIRRR
jgi:hypothetical protein